MRPLSTMPCRQCHTRRAAPFQEQRPLVAGERELVEVSRFMIMPDRLAVLHSCHEKILAAPAFTLAKLPFRST